MLSEYIESRDGRITVKEAVVQVLRANNNEALKLNDLHARVCKLRPGTHRAYFVKVVPKFDLLERPATGFYKLKSEAAP